MTFPSSMMLFAVLSLATSVAAIDDVCHGGPGEGCPSANDYVAFMQKNMKKIVARSEQGETMLASDMKPSGKDKSWRNKIINRETIETPTCLQELEVRKVFSVPHDPLEHGSEMLRLVFHDALDFNNLHDETGQELNIPKPYGGVDGCLFSGAKKGDDGKWHPDPGHNNGLRDSITLSTLAQKTFPNISKADLKVVASLAALEEDAKGPHVPMKWGRSVPEDCEARAGEYEGNLETNVGGTQWIHTNPDLNSFDHQTLMDVFLKIGLTQTDMVALMGAHTYGDVSVCSKVLNRVEVGNFCGGESRPTHWEEVGGHDQIRPVGAFDKNFNVITQPNTKGKWMKKSRAFDDGAVWDQTPSCFDNRYYQTFANANFEWKDGCCGRAVQRSPSNGGDRGLPWKRKHRFNESRVSKDPYCLAGRGREDSDDVKVTYYTNGKKRNGGDICDETHPWCFSNWPYDGDEKRDKATMRNVYDYGFQNYQAKLQTTNNTYGRDAGWMKPLFRTPTEWSLLNNPTSLKLLKEYAASELAFFDAFAAAYTKVLEMTPQKDALETCRTSSCAFDVGSNMFVCDGNSFAADSVDCPAPPFGAACAFVQVIGTRAVLDCYDGTPRLCCQNQPCTKTIRAWQHKTQVTLGTCFDDPSVSEPNTGDTAVTRDASFAQ